MWRGPSISAAMPASRTASASAVSKGGVRGRVNFHPGLEAVLVVGAAPQPAIDAVAVGQLRLHGVDTGP